MEISIGIDLGSTHSVVAVKGHVEFIDGYPPGEYIGECDVTVIPTPEGDKTFPSVLWVAPDDPENILVGIDAKQKAEEGECPIMFSKRSIGTDERLTVSGREFTAGEVAARLLEYFKRCAERALGRPVHRAVVTHPAYFSPNQVEETKRAAVAAGFDMALPEQMLMEPVAVALAYLRSVEKDPLTMMTYDLGGGTFDVTVLQRKSGVTDMRSFDGDPLLGGYLFDRRLVEWVLARLAESGRKIPYDPGDPSNRGRWSRLITHAERVKLRLSEARTPKVYVEFRAQDVLVDAAGWPVPILERLNREQYAELIKDYLDQTIECSLRALEKAKVLQEELDMILLIGGSSYGPWVEEAVRKAFGSVEVQLFSPDLCVAAGAAIRAADLPPAERKGEIQAVFYVPSRSALPSIDISGEVKKADGTPLDDASLHRLRVFLSDSDTGIHELCEFSSGGHFLFKDLDLSEDKTTGFILRISDDEGLDLLTRSFGVEYAPNTATFTEIAPALPKTLYVETSRGHVPIAEEGTPLPVKIKETLKRTHTEPELEIPVFLDEGEIGRIRIENIPEKAGEGSKVELEIEITKHSEIRGEARVLTRSGAVAANCKVRIAFPPLQIPTLPELRARFDKLEIRRRQEACLSVDPGRRMLLSGKGENDAAALERQFVEMEPDRPMIHRKLREFERMVHPPDDDMHPPLNEFAKLADDCRKKIDLIEAGPKKDPFGQMLEGIEKEGNDAFSYRNRKRWSHANESLENLHAKLPKEGSKSDEEDLPPTPILKDHFRSQLSQHFAALNLMRERISRLPEYEHRFKPRCDRIEREIDEMERAIDSVPDDLDPKRALYALGGKLRGIDRIAGKITSISCDVDGEGGVGKDFLSGNSLFYNRSLSMEGIFGDGHGKHDNEKPKHSDDKTLNKEKTHKLDKFNFSAFFPEKIGPRDISKIVAYVHLESVARDVARKAVERLDLPPGINVKAHSVSRPVPKESVIKVTPDIEGLVFDTLEATMSLWEEAQFVEFRFKPKEISMGHVCRGWIHYWLDGIILADVPVSIFVADEDVPEIFRQTLAEGNARPYRLVFPSYSHDDEEIVERLESYAVAFGDEYLRDVRKLRAGQRWSEELRQYIKRADIFQLFWSNNAAASEYVGHEWQHALNERISRPDPYFLRPVYWSSEPAPIPQELQVLHFARVPL